MKAVVYTGDNSAEYTDVDSPVVQDGQTRVDLSFCGICGSDMLSLIHISEPTRPY